MIAEASRLADMGFAYDNYSAMEQYRIVAITRTEG
jgi:hypothetical protein